MMNSETARPSEIVYSMRGSRKFCQRQSNFDNVFLLLLFSLVDEGREDLNNTIDRPS